MVLIPTDRVAILTVLLFLVAPAVSADGVELHSGIIIEQPGNNATINVTDRFNVSILTAYDNATYLDHSNFSITPDTAVNTTVNLSWFNRSAAHGQYLANYTVTTTAATNLTYRFTNLTQNELYAVAHNTSHAATYANTSAGGVFTFTDAVSQPTSYRIWRAGRLADWVRTTPRSFAPTTDQVTIGGTNRGVQPVMIQNNRSDYTWPAVPTADWVTPPTGCSQYNTSAVDVAPGTANHSLGFECTPGVVGQTVLKVKDGQPTTDYTTEVYTTDNLTIHSNATENTTVVWPILKERLERWRDREAGSATAEVDGSNQNISVRENSTHVLVRIGTAHGNSSLHQGRHTTAMSYYYATSPGGSPPDKTQNQSAPGTGLSATSQTVTGRPSETVDATFTIENDASSRRIVAVEPVNRSLPGCDYVQLQQSEISTMYGDVGEYRVAANGDVTPRLRATIPEQQVLNAVETDEVYCEYNVSEQGQPVTTFLVTIAADPSLPDRINDATRTHLVGLELFTQKDVCWPPATESGAVLDQKFTCPEEWQVTTEWWPTLPAMTLGGVVLLFIWFLVRRL